MFGRRGASSGKKWGLIGGLIAAGAAAIPLISIIKKRTMSVTTILKKDHRIVSGLLMTLEMTQKANRTIRKTLFDQIRTNLMLHMQAEEAIVYPAMRMLSFGPEEEKVNEAGREHQLVKDLLGQMGGMDTCGDAFEVTLRELKWNIQHHVEEEENEMFVWMTQRMSADQLEDLGRRLHEKKKDLKGQMAA
jgi:iron-sulfur cluster repair protein YtfE (RIC family)